MTNDKNWIHAVWYDGGAGREKALMEIERRLEREINEATYTSMKFWETP